MISRVPFLSLTLLILFAMLPLHHARAGDIAPVLHAGPGYESLTPEALASWMGEITLRDGAHAISLLDPADGAYIPADAASPIFRWEDAAARTWQVNLTQGARPLATAILDKPQWIPDMEDWKRIQSLAGNDPVQVRIIGLGGWTLREGISTGTTSFIISPDPIGAKLAFIRKPLPFRKAKENPQEGQVVIADLADFAAPAVVFQDQPVCFNCHSFSHDGSYGMDVDYKGDKGGYLLKKIGQNMEIGDRDIVSWNDMEPPAPAKYSMGLFTLFSPDGRWATSTVGETSAFVMLDDLAYSQMFFPATGHIGLMDRTTGKLTTLAGANDPAFVQTTPAFSADSSRLAFARAPVQPELVQAILEGRLLAEDPHQKIDKVNAKYPVKFDLFHLPFNQGKGGSPVPLEGASANGMSNFFPRYSPDGKWLVFTQAETGLVLQPSSRLVLIPSGGGVPQLLAANTDRMNSWHSWSPNAKWLAFSSKGNSFYTEIFITHIDGQGQSSPALRLFRLSSEAMAAMVPEFLPPKVARLPRLTLANPEEAKGKSMASDGR